MAQSKVHSYILLDRTGSMSSIWTEALSSVNAYAGSIASDAGDIVPAILRAAARAEAPAGAPAVIERM